VGCDVEPRWPDNSDLSPRFFVCWRRQGGVRGRRCWRQEGQRAGGCQLGAGRRSPHPWRASLESRSLAGARILKARGWRSLSLCLFPCNATSACNLRQVGEEKKRKGKKKKKGKLAQLFPPLPPPLSPPRPGRSHVTVIQRWLWGCSAGSARGSPGDKPQLSAWSRERKALGGRREKIHLGEK